MPIESTAEIRETFEDVDFVGEKVVFNIAWNHYRLVAFIAYKTPHGVRLILWLEPRGFVLRRLDGRNIHAAGPYQRIRCRIIPTGWALTAGILRPSGRFPVHLPGTPWFVS
jgi:hypothetical protein